MELVEAARVAKREKEEVEDMLKDVLYRREKDVLSRKENTHHAAKLCHQHT